MNFEKEKIFVYYKRLISLYPQSFKERFGESMKQTFNDVCNEQKKLKGRIPVTFVFSTFAETSVGVLKENLSALKGAYRMNYWFKNIGIAALFSVLFTVAFWSLGMWLNPNIPSEMESEGQSLIGQVLFNWLVLTLVFTPIVSGLRNGENISMKDWLFPMGAAVLLGSLLIAPFAFMEYWNNPVIQSGEIPFPLMLFFALWTMPVIFFLGATPIVRSVWAGESVLAHPISLVLRIIFLAFLAILWLNLLIDQMPCFLGGVPGCD